MNIEGSSTPKYINKLDTELGKVYSSESPSRHFFIRTGGYSNRVEELGFVNLRTGKFTPMEESTNKWYPVDAKVVLL